MDNSMQIGFDKGRNARVPECCELPVLLWHTFWKTKCITNDDRFVLRRDPDSAGDGDGEGEASEPCRWSVADTVLRMSQTRSYGLLERSIGKKLADKTIQYSDILASRRMAS